MERCNRNMIQMKNGNYIIKFSKLAEKDKIK